MIKMRKLKGFVFVETMVVIAFLATILLTVYSSFNTVLDNSKTRLFYDDPIYMYRTYYLLSFLESNNITDYIDAKFENAGSNLGIIEFGCNSQSVIKDSDTRSFCENIKSEWQIKHIFIMKYDVNSIVACAENTSADLNTYCRRNTALQNLSVGAVNYLYTLDGYTGSDRSPYSDSKRYRLVVEYEKPEEHEYDYFDYKNGQAMEKEHEKVTTYKYYYSSLEIPYGIDDKATAEKEALNKDPNVLYNKLKSNAVDDNKKSDNVSANTGIDFSKPSSDTNGKGIYTLSSTKDDEYPIRYYRGNVSNNNVLFAGLCWKIVRTTDTGGTKLVFNGSPGSAGNCAGTNSLIGTSNFNSSASSLAYSGYMYGVVHMAEYISMYSSDEDYYFNENPYYEKNGAQYAPANHYILGTNTKINSFSWSGNYNNILPKHYFCNSPVCSIVNYIHSANATGAYITKLTNGQKIEDAVADMTSASTNTTNSVIKNTIDQWYKNNLNNYTKYLEDSVWCNDRSIDQLGGFDPSNKSTFSPLYFSTKKRITNTYKLSLTCSNQSDNFTVSEANGNGNLTYPVGLLTVDEIALSGGKSGTANTSYYLNNGQNWWTMSPYYFGQIDSIDNYYVSSDGKIATYNVRKGTYGVRPSIVLKHSIKINNGDGSASKPYIVDTSK